MEYRVRQGNEDDVTAMLGLWREMMDFHAELDRRFRPLPPLEGEQAWEKHLREDVLGAESACTFVAEAGDRLVGMIVGLACDVYPVFQPEQYGLVSDMVVAPDWRRRGVGRALFDSVKTWSSERGMSHLKLMVAHANPVSQAFWRAMGCTDYMDDMWFELDAR
jgi:ribosomal protein S18 acetylase RimI-like enzyme